MSVGFNEMFDAIRDAEQQLRYADGISDRLAKMLIGRLRRAELEQCVALKHELRNFNATTKRWKR